MKLVSLFCLGALSLAGCADDATVGGGQGEGITPSKISFVTPEEPEFDPSQVFMVEQKLGAAPADAVCDGCISTSYRIVDNSYGITEVQVVSDGGIPVCKIFLDQNGIFIDQCDWRRP